MANSAFIKSSISLDSPVFTTNITTPRIYGGALRNSTICIVGTSSATTTSSCVLLQPASGKVGIGTTTPRVKTELVADVAAPTSLSSVISDGHLLMGDGGNVGMVMGTYSSIGGNYPSYIQARNLAANNLPYNLILQPLGGNVGIGTVAPLSPLQIRGTGGDVEINDGFILMYDRVGANGYRPMQLRACNFCWLPSDVLKMSLSNGGVLTINSLASGNLTSASGVITSSSDKIYKTEDDLISNAIDKVMNLTPRYFYWNEKAKEEIGIDSNIRQLGFFAQEVNAALGEEVANTPEEGKTWGIYDRGIIAMLTKAMQEQQLQMQKLMEKVETTELELSTTQSQLEEALKRIEFLENK